jgi:OOP family OmpA-OmpF porin
MQFRYLLLVSTSIFLSTNASAQDAGAFVGVGIANSRESNLSANRFTEALQQAGRLNAVTSVDTSANGYSIFAGYRWNPWFAVEMRLQDLGDFFVDSKWSYPSGTTSDSMRTKLDVKAQILDVVVSAPVSERFRVNGRVGAASSKVGVTVSTSQAAPFTGYISSKTKTSPHIGFELEFDLTKEAAIRAGVERILKIGDNTTAGELKVNTISASAVYRF